MGLVDSHAHLTFAELRHQIDEVLTRCKAAGVDQVITVGITVEDGKAAVKLTDRYPERIRAAAGFHPHEAGAVTEAGFASMAALWDHPNVVAIGEIGLDYHYDFADRAVQRSVFARQLQFAAERRCPLIIHCREAFDDTIQILIDHGFANRPAVFHCFTGTETEASRLAEHNWRISFTGIVTFRKSAWLQEIAKAYPADRMMLETDSPYLSPEPVRGKGPNEPAHVAHTARFLAELRCATYEEFAEQTARNTRTFFNL